MMPFARFRVMRLRAAGVARMIAAVLPAQRRDPLEGLELALRTIQRRPQGTR